MRHAWSVRHGSSDIRWECKEAIRVGPTSRSVATQARCCACRAVRRACPARWMACGPMDIARDPKCMAQVQMHIAQAQVHIAWDQIHRGRDPRSMARDAIDPARDLRSIGHDPVDAAHDPRSSACHALHAASGASYAACDMRHGASCHRRWGHDALQPGSLAMEGACDPRRRAHDPTLLATHARCRGSANSRVASQLLRSRSSAHRLGQDSGGEWCEQWGRREQRRKRSHHWP
jgi:hypothetical protein